MKILEYASNIWVDISSNPVRDDTPFLCIGPKTYTELNTHFKRTYNIDIVYTRYISEDDGVYLFVELKDTNIDFETINAISIDCGKINIGAESSVDETHPSGYTYLYLAIPIEQEVETFNID